MRCLYCKSEETIKYFEAYMPNILSACPSKLSNKVKLFKFEASMCTKCNLGFNSSRLSDEDLEFVYDNYLGVV